MPTKITLDPLYRNPVTGYLESGYPPIPISIVYDFADGDEWIDKDGWDWHGSARSVSTNAGERGALYQYSGGNDPFGDGAGQPEQRFSMPELGEFWFKRRIYIPENYEHRKLMVLTLEDATGWEIGDYIHGLENTTTGQIRYKSGNKIGVTNAVLPLTNAQWNTTITNVTKSLTSVGSGRSLKPNNNKFQVFFCDGYSQAGQSPTLVYQLLVQDFPDGTWGNGSTISLQISVDGYGSGQLPNTNIYEKPFLSAEDVGIWVDVIFYAKMSSALGVNDGVSRVWLRRPNDSNYVLKLSSDTLDMAERTGSGKFREGYIWGWANSGYENPTLFSESVNILSETSIDGV